MTLEIDYRKVVLTWEAHSRYMWFSSATKVSGSLSFHTILGLNCQVAKRKGGSIREDQFLLLARLLAFSSVMAAT